MRVIVQAQNNFPAKDKQAVISARRDMSRLLYAQLVSCTKLTT